MEGLNTLQGKHEESPFLLSLQQRLSFHPVFTDEKASSLFIKGHLECFGVVS